MTLRDDGLAYATITFLIAPLVTFYTLNDVVLNKRKISRYFGEYKKVVKDRAYFKFSLSGTRDFWKFQNVC